MRNLHFIVRLLSLYLLVSSAVVRAEEINIVCTTKRPDNPFVVFLPNGSMTAMIKFGSGGTPFPAAAIVTPNNIELRHTFSPGLYIVYYIDRASGRYEEYIETPSLQSKSKLMDTGNCIKQQQPAFRMF
jgi:hypothetical protein